MQKPLSKVVRAEKLFLRLIPQQLELKFLTQKYDSLVQELILIPLFQKGLITAKSQLNLNTMIYFVAILTKKLPIVITQYYIRYMES